MLREDLSEQRVGIRQLHDRKLSGPQVSAKLATLIDGVVKRLFEGTLEELAADSAEKLRGSIAIVGLGSYARRQCAPYSDVDLMILHNIRSNEEIVEQLRPLTQGVFDVGLQLGHSVRTNTEAVQLAREDAIICTSMIDARFLLGNQRLFESFRANFQRMMQRNSKSLCRSFFDARTTERDQYGETVYLLEPHVKRSRGALRDLNLLGWTSFAEHGLSDPDRLHLMGALSKFDYRRLLSARDFLLRLRNEMHFHADRAHDLFDRAEQLRVAQWHGHTHSGGLLPVEHFMRDYFRHTNHLWQMVRRRDAKLQVVSRVKRVLDPMLGKTIDGDYRVGLQYVSATSSGIEKLKRDMGQLLRFVKLSVSQEKHIDPVIWSALLLAAPDFPEAAPDDVRQEFYELLADSKSVGEVLRVLHELGYLEKIVPAMRHARYLLQFNQYHKYTVDEHCLRAVRKAAAFADRKDALGTAYRDIEDKRILHLALLLHDLGKGFEEDHSEVGRRIAEETAALLSLDSQSTSDVVQLVHKHLVMSHLTFRRDTSDERVIRRFAREVGSVDRLRMFFVLSCADLAAVGPHVLNDWKMEVLADVCQRSINLLKEDGRGTAESKLEEYRQDLLGSLTTEEQADLWFERQIETLPASYLAGTRIEDAAEMLRRFHALHDSAADVWANYQADTNTIEFIAGVDQGAGRGIFSNMAGALSSHGIQILSADTDVLSDGLLLLRYVVSDRVSSQGPAGERLDEVCRSLVASVDSELPPKFRSVWGQEQEEVSKQLSALPNEVRIDNTLSDDYTIVEVFTFDRTGLLYELARKLHDLQLVIGHAKIGTYLDQVVDVFYVTSSERKKITDQQFLSTLREKLLTVIDPV